MSEHRAACDVLLSVSVRRSREFGGGGGGGGGGRGLRFVLVPLKLCGHDARGLS